MRGLLQKIDPSLWAQYSSLIFFVTFIALVIWVCLPFQKRTQKVLSEMPLKEND